MLIRHAIIVSKDAIFLGSSLSCDEETMGCKGMHPDIILNVISLSPQVKMKFDFQKKNLKIGAIFVTTHLDHVQDKGMKSSRHSLQYKTQ